MAKSISDKKAVYNSLGTQKGEATNFIAVGSSAHGVLNDDYYWQNYYEPNLYREAIDNGLFPIYRGIKMSKDDSIRREIIRHIRTFFNVEFSFFENILSPRLLRLFQIICKNTIKKFTTNR